MQNFPPEAQKIKSQNLRQLLEIMGKKALVLAPQADKYGDIYFQPVSDTSQVILKHFKPLMPAVREVLFKQMEKMIRFKKEASGTKLESVDESEEIVLFGLPNCDLDGILYNDVFFEKREFIDFYYSKARKKLAIITIACINPPNENCFCASMGHGPFADEGFDLQLTDLGNENFLVNVGSKKGEAWISENSALFASAGSPDISLWTKIRKEAEELPKKSFINKDRAIENMGMNPLNEKIITDISNRCVSCGACNYACPTCTCFTVCDCAKDGEGTRSRILDSCVLAGYFRMAGGHNPKSEKEERTRNRYFCKLLWDKEKFGDSGCVGCGRCLDSCPAGIDIKEVIRSLALGKEK